MGSSNREEQERVRNLLLDTVTLLCKNGLSFKKQLKVQGLLGITMDENDVFIVHINEQVGEISVEHHKKDSDKKNADIPDDCSENSIESWRSKDSTPSKAHTDKISHRKRTSTSSPIFKGPPEKVKIKTEKQDESACDLIFVGEEDDKSRIPKLPMMQGNAGYGAVPPMGAGPPGTFNQFSSNIQGNVQPGPFITGIVPNPQHSQDNTDKFSDTSAMSWYGTPTKSVRKRRGELERSEKKFVCEYPECGLRYFNKRHMLRHQTRVHGRPKQRGKFSPQDPLPLMSFEDLNTTGLQSDYLHTQNENMRLGGELVYRKEHQDGSVSLFMDSPNLSMSSEQTNEYSNCDDMTDTFQLENNEHSETSKPSESENILPERQHSDSSVPAGLDFSDQNSVLEIKKESNLAENLDDSNGDTVTLFLDDEEKANDDTSE